MGEQLVERVIRSSGYRLSAAQQRIWFEDQLHPGSPLQSDPWRFRLKGDLDRELLEKAFRMLTGRHAALGTRFMLVDGIPSPFAAPPAESGFHLPVFEFCEESVQREAQRPFDLSRDLLLRAALFRRDNRDHDLLVVLHDIGGDARSAAELLAELGRCYSALRRGERAPMPPPVSEDADCTEHEQLEAGRRHEALDFWTRTLRSAPVLELAGDRPRPDSRTIRGARIPFALDAGATAAFNRFLERNGLDLETGLTAVFQVLLARYSGQDEICTGLAHDMRLDEESRVIGPLTNMLVLRSCVASNPLFRDFAAELRRTVTQARAYGDVPFDAIVQAVQPPRDPSRTPLFQALLAVRPPDWNRLSLEELEATPVPVHNGTSKFDLTLSAWRSGAGLEGTLEYSSDLFDAATARRMAGHLEMLAGGAEADSCPAGSMPMLTVDERSMLIVDWNRTARPRPPVRVHDLVLAQCRRTPGRIAVRCGARSLSYAELDSRANAVAHRLFQLGVGRGKLAGVCVERSLDMVSAVLGVLKSGAAYVPLDPAYPPERLEFMLRDSGAAAVVTQAAFRPQLESAGIDFVLIDNLDEEAAAGNPAPPVADGELAYVIYTSGSTGRPKGVAVRHEGLTNFILSMREEPGFTESDTLLAVTTLCFDIAGLELYLPLIAGGSVVIATREEARDGEKLKRAIETAGITVLQATPATWPMLIEAGWKGSPRLKVLCGGEAMPSALAAQLLARAGEVWNMYGPTETTVWSSVYRVRGGERSIPVGKPIANTQFYIVDRWNQPSPPGVPGELLIGGQGVAAGYFNDREKTAAKFIPNPVPGAPAGLVYRTGDLARFLPDGNVELLGRMDNQVKLRGFRIELGEIEAALASHPGVRHAAVALQEDERGEKTLVGFVTALQGGNVAEAELKALLRAKLPEYMVPSLVELLDEMPQTPNGKIDRKALPRVKRSLAPGAGETECDITELRLMRIWSDVLGVQPGSVEQSFFELGGHSLIAARLLARVEREFGKKLPLASLFAAPTIAQQAAMLRGEGEARWPRVVTVQPHGSLPPFFFVGGGFNFLNPLAQRLHALGLDRPFLSLAHPRLNDLARPEVKDLAAYHLETVRQMQPHGPYVLGGFCAEGVVAYEMAQQLRTQGEETVWLGMFEAENRADRRMARDYKRIISTFALTSRRLATIRREGVWRYIRTRSVTAWRLLRNYFHPRMEAIGGHRFLFDFTELALYQPKPFAGRIHLFRRRMDETVYPDPNLGWGGLIEDLIVFEMPGSHLGMFEEPAVEALATEVAAGILADMAQPDAAVQGA